MDPKPPESVEPKTTVPEPTTSALKPEAIKTGGRVMPFVKHPVTNILVGVAVAAFFWEVSRSTLEPVYVVTPVEVVARRESPKLAVSWEGQPIDNLCVSTVVFWNDGKTPLTQDRLTPTTDPLRIVASGGVRILEPIQVNGSRPTLNIEPIITETAVVTLPIRGGDALEHGDGAAIKLLMTGNCSATRLAIRGRVIGTTTGFVEKRARLSQADLLREKFTMVLGLLLGCYFALEIRSAIKKKNKALTVAWIIVAVGMLGLTAFLASVVYIQGAVPSWAPQPISRLNPLSAK